jgi:hypothetical protein
MAAIPYDVAEAFMRKERAKRGNFESTGDNIYSYRLRLATWHNGLPAPLWAVAPEVARSYSVTTSRHVSALLAALPYNA